MDATVLSGKPGWVRVDHFTKVTMTCEASHYDYKKPPQGGLSPMMNFGSP